MTRIGLAAAAILILLSCGGCGPSAPVPALVVRQPGKPVAPPAIETIRIARGDTLDALFARAGLDSPTRFAMIAAIRRRFDVRKLRDGAEFTILRSASGAVESLEYLIDPDHQLLLMQTAGVFSAAVVEVPATIRTVPVCASLEGSLFESLGRAGEAPHLAIEMARIFAWDLDFYTDPQEGDAFCLLIEKKEYENGQPPTYGRILAARYENAGKLYEAYLFPDEHGRPQYYGSDGRSLQAAFLRSPMKFEARVSSRFSRRRFHPVLKIYRPHLGTDYAAPAGTTVQSIAAGHVLFSGWSGGAGNLVKIRHAGGFESQYLHLSRRYVRAGQRVEQGQAVGAVGSTGLSTGPHLDFRLRHNGRYVEFERLRPPRLTTIPAARMAAFAADRDRYAEMMSVSSARAPLPEPAPGPAPVSPSAATPPREPGSQAGS